MTTEKIKQFIIEQLESYGPINTTDINTFNFIDSGHIDSLGIMKFMVYLEAEFNFKFSDEELLSEDFKTVSGLTKLIEYKL